MRLIALILAALACTAWGYLLLLRGGFWRAAERDDEADIATTTHAWPRVVAIVPARDEAETIATTIDSLCRQVYAGEFRIIVVDDNSTDDTATLARSAAMAASAAERLVVLSAPELAVGWTGKLAAMEYGFRHLESLPEPPDYVLFTDADICYTTDALACLVSRALQDGLVLNSLMAKLHCVSFAERALMPAFIFFFQMLYPFGRINRAELRTAAAAGGCMLVQRNALTAAGGIAAIRGELIDDCALGRLMKQQGPIRLSLTNRAHSLRAFRTIGEIRPMISRSAYAQLHYSPWLLFGTVLALAVTCLAPPLLTFAGTGATRILAAGAWSGMALAFQPILRFYGVSRWWGMAFPAIAGLYLAFTLDSAQQHVRGRGGMWKGRAHCPSPERPA
ncbi:MAG: glycosyltransferase [Betaproteobacteria bacterium]